MKNNNTSFFVKKKKDIYRSSYVTIITLLNLKQAWPPICPKNNKGGKILQKLRCCIGGGKLQDNLLLSTELMIWIGHFSSISPLSE